VDTRAASAQSLCAVAYPTDNTNIKSAVSE
jgi:hypothetical protein